MKSNEELQRHASELLARAKTSGISSLRLLGGVAIRRLYPEPSIHPGLDRVCKDLDFAVARKDAKRLSEVFRDCGFEADRHFNALHGETRMMFASGELQADVFVGEFSQCHKLSLEPRLHAVKETLSPADLLLMKLQVVEINEKDLQDLCIILLGAEVGVVDASAVINLSYITRLTSQDWGWFTTCTDTVTKLRKYAAEKLAGAQQKTVQNKLDEMEQAILDHSKSMKWKIRNAVGRKVLWYQLPEEARR